MLSVLTSFIMHQNYCELSCRKIIKSFIQGFLPGIALKIFLILLPTILMIMSRIEGFTSLSSLERKSAGKYHLFLLVNVFLGSIVTGTALQQLHKFLNQSPTEYVNLLLFSMKGLLSSVNIYVFWRIRGKYKMDNDDEALVESINIFAQDRVFDHE